MFVKICFQTAKNSANKLAIIIAANGVGKVTPLQSELTEEALPQAVLYVVLQQEIPQLEQATVVVPATTNEHVQMHEPLSTGTTNAPRNTSTQNKLIFLTSVISTCKLCLK